MEQTGFRNVGIQNSDAGELPRRKHTTGICPIIVAKTMRNGRTLSRQRFETGTSTNKNLAAVRQAPPARFND
jgi:hypothetical protein